jgi:ParB family transcriptional regulator, chromosome partitioning protein
MPALFGGSAGSADHFRRIPIDRIRPRSTATRRTVDAERLAELAESIRTHGVLQPIRLRPRGAGEYEIIAGERRWRAAQQAGLRQVPALIAVTDDDQADVESLIENVQREDLNAVDRALALKRLRVNLGLRSWEDVGRVIGLTRQHVHNLLRVTELPAPMQDDVRAGDLTEKHCRALLRLRADPDAQAGLWEQIHRETLRGDAAIAESKRVHRAAPRDDAVLPRRPRIGAAVDALVRVLGQATAGDVAAARAELVELHALIGGVLAAASVGTVPAAAITPLGAVSDVPGDAGWRPVLIPAVGGQAG